MKWTVGVTTAIWLTTAINDQAIRPPQQSSLQRYSAIQLLTIQLKNISSYSAVNTLRHKDIQLSSYYSYPAIQLTAKKIPSKIAIKIFSCWDIQQFSNLAFQLSSYIKLSSCQRIQLVRYSATIKTNFANSKLEVKVLENWLFFFSQKSHPR